MQQIDGRFVYSASDLNDYLECKRLTELGGLVAREKLAAPSGGEDPQVELVRRKGEEHERAYLDGVRALHGEDVVAFERPESNIDGYRAAERRTLEAMQAGARVIYQATFFDGRFIGHADFLRRIDRPSNLGTWSYEAIDTKLALSAKPYFLVQLCNYSEHIERLQGCMPEYGAIVLGSGEERRYRLHDYLAYYRHLKSAFLVFAGDAARDAQERPSQYPHKCGHCKYCRWNDECTAARVADDHLSLVAWMRRDQIDKFETVGIATVAGLAQASDAARPAGLNPDTFVKLRRQAMLQMRGRSEGPVYELLRHEPHLGFGLLPQPAPGDVFFDMEGDPLFEPGRGLEYLFGCWIPGETPEFRALWALDRPQEARRFEEFVDFVTERRARHPSMHVYHYASYEKSTLRRLAQAHATREAAVDPLLRGEVLVDLYAVVRQALAISEDSYGLKRLERFYRLARATDIVKGDQSIVMFERWLHGGDPAILADIEAYNKDDCRSTYLLREWLLERRVEAMKHFGVVLPFRPVKAPAAPCHDEFLAGCKSCEKRRGDEREEGRRGELERALQAGALAPQTQEEYRLMSADRRMRYLLANLLAYHRREEKPAWWDYYDRCDNVDQLLEFDREAIAHLVLQEHIPTYKREGRRNNVYTYAFPDQLHKLSPGDAPHDPRTRKGAGTIVEIDDENNRLGLERGGTIEEARALTDLIPATPLPSKPQRDALERIARSYADGTLHRERPATFDLLAARDPRLSIPDGDRRVLQPERVTAESVSAVVRSLDRSYIFVQGPPGSGKSTIGSQVIADLLALGKRVGVLSTGHKAIHHLLHKVEERVAERHGSFRGLYKHSKQNPGSRYESRLPAPFVESRDDNEVFEGAAYDLAAGTAWLFARKELTGAFDYLFIDEAGQVSLANAVAVSACARNVVLLGDPSQLAQVSQGKHPLHAGDSILQHLLGDAQTVPPHRGIFLDVSYRMQPQVCAFVSDAMYEGRLAPAPQTALHRLEIGGQSRAGLYYLPIEHAGNGSESAEEADRIVREISLLRDGTLVDSQPPEFAGIQRPIRDSDIIVVTPYNAQRRLIARKLKDAGLAVPVGTVDKFQGQEAAVVFYSMATSSGEEIPRDLEFLFERNRFNVAISRARTASVLLCNPRLLDVACRTTEQMALVNLLCAFEQSAARWDACFV